MEQGKATTQQQSVRIDKTVGENMIKVSVSRGFGQSEQVNAEMDVPVGQSKEAVDLMFANVITPRAMSYAQEVVDYQLKQDLMAYTSQERDIILKNQPTIEANVKARLKKGK